MNLLNNVFDLDRIEINHSNQKYLLIFGILMILVLIVFLLKKDYYYENTLIVNDNEILLLTDREEVNKIVNNDNIWINEIRSDYSIDKIINQDSICYVSIKLNIPITNITSVKYKILLGKETIFEYFVRIIRKVS